MSCTRALVGCTILSLRDSCFLYPYCKCCLSRLTHDTSDRATCGRCGFTCELQNVGYRYRLSVTVSRNQDMFDVTVFGGCLNPFFGITAGGLHRFIELERTGGTQPVQQLLTKAVEDCFTGTSVVLGLKGSCDDVKTWSEDQQTSSLILKSKELVACQMISPSEAFAKCTVIGYLKHLLQLNSYSCDCESANSSMCLPQQIHSHSLERDELSSFEHTLPSCARLNSQASGGDFTLSVWQSPGLCFNQEEIKHDSLQSPKNEDNTTFECFWSCPLDQKHDDELKNQSGCDMFQSSVHFSSSATCDSVSPSDASSCGNDSEVMTSCQCVLKLKPSDNNDEPYCYKSILSEQNVCLDLQDAALSEDLLDFVSAEPLNYNSNSKTASSVQNCCDENSNFKKTRILADLNLNVSPDVVHVLHSPKNSRLCFSNRKELTSQRKTLTRNKLSVALCSPNHEHGKYFRQSEIQSEKCKVKQEHNVREIKNMYNCSMDLFACQNSLDLNQSDVTEFCNTNEPSHVNKLVPGVSGSQPFSPCLQSTPVSYQHTYRQKDRWSLKRVDCSKGLRHKFPRDNKPKVTMSENVGSVERFSGECNVKGVSLDSSVNVNEWSRDLFDSF